MLAVDCEGHVRSNDSTPPRHQATPPPITGRFFATTPQEEKCDRHDQCFCNLNNDFFSKGYLAVRILSLFLAKTARKLAAAVAPYRASSCPSPLAFSQASLPGLLTWPYQSLLLTFGVLYTCPSTIVILAIHMHGTWTFGQKFSAGVK